MLTNWGVAGAAAMAVLVGNVAAAQAQRATENAVTKAEDAFGTQVGNENVGLYGIMSARGFSPEQAGNLRIEGLYFDQQARFGNRISKGTVMRVGLSALSYPFPAPTGIGDIQLRIPGDDTQMSAAISYGYPTGQPLASVSSDAEVALIPGKLGAGIGLSVYRRVAEWRGDNVGVNAGATMHWTPNDNLEIIPLMTLNFQLKDDETQPLILSGGAYLPPDIDRSVFYRPEMGRPRDPRLQLRRHRPRRPAQRLAAAGGAVPFRAQGAQKRHAVLPQCAAERRGDA